jgi:glycosyltransferase involved in cell wall biosynthesis
MGVSVKPKLLFLAHLLPWPLEGGGQIKSYQALCLLASHFEVTVLAFIRSNSERQNALPLQSLCKGGLQMVLLPRSRWRDMAAVGRAAATGGSLLISRDASPTMCAAVRVVLASEKFTAVHVDHLQMMQFVPPSGDPLLAGTRVILDQHNIEHRILQRITQVGQGIPPLVKCAARWDLPRLRKLEKAACVRADRVLAVSTKDSDAIRDLLGSDDAGGKVAVTPIGVDTDYFVPVTSRGDRHLPGPILSVGTMYWPPNVDAVKWFCEAILPLVRQDFPDALFQIVGTRPTQSVRALAAAQPDIVTVTGTVPDVRPYMAACGVFVVPLRVGSGMRVKILNAMAMGLPIVSTTLGAEGITVTQGKNILLADTADDFVEAIGQVLTYPALAERLGRAARDLVVERYSREISEQKLLRVYREAGVLGSEVRTSEETLAS